MITNKDIAKLAAVLATKEDVRELREDTDELTQSVRSLTTSVEHLAVRVAKLVDEHKSIAHIFDRHDKWIRKLGDKTKIELKD